MSDFISDEMSDRNSGRGIDVGSLLRLCDRDGKSRGNNEVRERDEGEIDCASDEFSSIEKIALALPVIAGEGDTGLETVRAHLSLGGVSVRSNDD